MGDTLSNVKSTERKIILSARQRKWRAANRERVSAWRKNWYAKNRYKLLAQKKNVSPEVKAKRAERQRKYYAEHRDEIRCRERASPSVRDRQKYRQEKNRIRYQMDPEYRKSIIEKSKKYENSRKGKETRAAHARSYYQKNKSLLLAKVHAHYELHRDRDIAKKREWRAKNPERCRKISRDKDARKLMSRGRHTFYGWMGKVAYYGWKCYYCGVGLSRKTLSQDHAIPLSRNGTNFLSNLIPCCRSCNSSKKDRTVQEFLALRLRSQTPVTPDP